MTTVSERPENLTSVSESLEPLKQYGQERGYNLGWLEKREVWGTHLEPTKGGLLLADVEQAGSHGHAPEESANLSGRPRGAVARPNAFRIGNYPVRTKSDIWLRNAAELWEEASARQWSSATDIPWNTLKPLPDDLERAECQFATFLTEVEFIAGDVPGKWIAYTTPDYFEPRMFLISQVMDEARHLDVFRKRALANGGGLLQRAAGAAAAAAGGGIDNARDFTEMSARTHIQGEGLVLTLFRLGELMGYNEAEKMIYRLCAQDESRHVAFGVMHLQYLGQTSPERREEIHCYLDESERNMTVGAGGQNPAGTGAASSEALAVMLGGGAEKYDEGMKLLMAARQRQIKEYIQRVRVAGFGERFENGRANKSLSDYARTV